MTIQKKFSHLGFAITLYLLLTNVISSMLMVVYYIVTLLPLANSLSESGVTDYAQLQNALLSSLSSKGSISASILLTIPTYLICVPLTMYFLNSMPYRDVPLKGLQFSTPYENNQKRDLSISEFFMFFMFTFPLSIVGSCIGQVLAMGIGKLTNHDLSNILSALLDNMPLPLVFLSTVILAPIFEELLYRYAVIGYCRRYGEWNAIIISALIFGLVHTNIYQFFYAFFLGLIFGYIYIYTRQIKYTIVMHMMFNALGAFIPLLLSPTMEDNVPLMVFYAIRIILSVVGLVLLVLFLKKGNLMKNSQFAPIQEKVSKKAILNPGMICLILVSLTLSIFMSSMGS